MCSLNIKKIMIVNIGMKKKIHRPRIVVYVYFFLLDTL